MVALIRLKKVFFETYESGKLRGIRDLGGEGEGGWWRESGGRWED